MAGDWIKMRGALINHPKVVVMSRFVDESASIRDWLCPGAPNDLIISNVALRYVTTAALLQVWSAAREHGKVVGVDLFLHRLSLADVDEMAGLEGFGAAMRAVGWAKQQKKPPGVIFPNFKEHNAPRTVAERVRDFRDRKNDAVTQCNESSVTNVTPSNREESDKSIRRNRISDARARGIFGDVTDELLRDTPALLAWLVRAASTKKPVLHDSEADRLNVLGMAERCIELGGKPAALFSVLVRKREWGQITIDQENRARKRLNAAMNGQP